MISEIEQVVQEIEQLKAEAQQKNIELPAELVQFPNEIPNSIKNLNILLEDLKLKAQQIQELISQKQPVQVERQAPSLGQGSFASEIETQKALLRAKQVIEKNQLKDKIETTDNSTDEPIEKPLPEITKTIVNADDEDLKIKERELDEIKNKAKAELIKKKDEEKGLYEDTAEKDLKDFVDKFKLKEEKEDLSNIGQEDLDKVNSISKKMIDYNKSIDDLASKIYKSIPDDKKSFNLKEPEFNKFNNEKEQIINSQNFNKSEFIDFTKNKERIISEFPEAFAKISKNPYNDNVEALLQEKIINLAKKDKKDLTVVDIVKAEETTAEKTAEERSIKMELKEFDEILPFRVSEIKKERDARKFTKENRDASIRTFNEIIKIGKDSDIYTEWLKSGDNEKNMLILKQFNIDSENRVFEKKIDAKIENAYQNVKKYLSKTDNKFTDKDYKIFEKLGMEKAQWDIRTKQGDKINFLNQWVKMWIENNPEYESSLGEGKIYSVEKDPKLSDTRPRPNIEEKRDAELKRVNQEVNNKILKDYISGPKNLEGGLVGNFTKKQKNAVKILFGEEFFNSLPKIKKDRDEAIKKKYLEINPSKTIVEPTRGVVSMDAGVVSDNVLANPPPRVSLNIRETSSSPPADPPPFQSAFRRSFQQIKPKQSFRK